MNDKSISRTICWFSSGAASAIASKMILSGGRGNIAVVICETGSEHPDNASRKNLAKEAAEKMWGKAK